jgi:hypothetical protein
MGPFGVSILHAEVSAAVKKASDKTASKIIVTDLICLIYFDVNHANGKAVSGLDCYKDQ